jgi:hypothetical protein
MPVITVIWNTLRSTYLTIIVAVLVCINTIWGSMMVVGNGDFFSEISHRLFMPWLLSREAYSHLSLTLWIYILLGLVTIFAVNAVVCTIDKLYRIYSKGLPARAFLPQVVHIGFLIAMLGHLIGATSGFKSQGNFVLEGEGLYIEQAHLKVTLDSLEQTFAPSGRPLSMVTALTIEDAGGVKTSGEISPNSPFIYKGTALYNESGGEFPTGLRLSVGPGTMDTMDVPFNGEFLAEGVSFRLGRLYPDLGVAPDGSFYSRSMEYRNPYQEVIAEDGRKGMLALSRMGGSVTLNGREIILRDIIFKDYVVITAIKDSGIWFIGIGSFILVCGMLLILILNPERGELLRPERSGHGG